MPVVFLKPSSETDSGPNIDTGVLADVDEGVDEVGGADGNLEVSIDKEWVTPFFIEWALESLPGDADSINSVILRVRNRIVGVWVDDSIQYIWSIVGTNVAHPLLQWDFFDDAGAGLADRQQTVTDSPTVANVNAATIRVTQAYAGSMAKEAITSDWDGFELEVDYNTATGTITAVGTITVSGDVSADAVNMARGTITLLGEGLSEATHLAQAITILLGDLAGIGTDISGGGEIPIFFYHYQHHLQ